MKNESKIIWVFWINNIITWLQNGEFPAFYYLGILIKRNSIPISNYKE